MKPSEMLAAMKALEIRFRDGGLNWPVDIKDPILNELGRLDRGNPLADYYVRLRDTMENNVAGLWTMYRKDAYYKWRRERFMEMHTEYSLEQQDRRSTLIRHCYNFSNTVKHHFRHLGHLIDNIENNPFAAQKDAPNPYFVEVSAITGIFTY